MTAIGGPERSLLLEPLGLLPELAQGAVAWDFSPLAFTCTARPGWAGSASGAVRKRPCGSRCEGELEADGAATFAVRLTVPHGAGSVGLDNVALRLVLDPRPSRMPWGWACPAAPARSASTGAGRLPPGTRTALWLGDSNIGVQLALRDDNYERPLNTNFYREKPLIAPESWANPGAGTLVPESRSRRATARPGAAAVVLKASSGGRTMAPGESLNYGFRLLLTPFKPIDPARQLRNRYFHGQGSVADIAATGASVINIHHATALAPFINDPLLHADALAEYTAQAHAAGLKVKVYDTVRELTRAQPGPAAACCPWGTRSSATGPARGTFGRRNMPAPTTFRPGMRPMWMTLPW